MATYSSSETTRKKMIHAAGELAAERGLDNVSTRAVAERSGENIGSIHYHFGSKQGLWEAVVEEAMSGCVKPGSSGDLDELQENPTPQNLSAMVRKVVSDEIIDLFRAGRPEWYSHVIYQLMQRDDDLYEVFRKGQLDPHLDFLHRLIGLIKPGFDDEEIFIVGCLMLMPIIAHANYSKVMQKRLHAKSFSDDYLKKLQDILVRQTQRLLDLPEDVQ